MKQIYLPRYCDANSILLVNQVGNLKRLYCPFRVKCKVQFEAFKPGMWLWVEQVVSTTEDELIFVILGHQYPHTRFIILATF